MKRVKDCLIGKKSKTLHENENSHQIQGIYMVVEGLIIRNKVDDGYDQF